MRFVSNRHTWRDDSSRTMIHHPSMRVAPSLAATMPTLAEWWVEYVRDMRARGARGAATYKWAGARLLPMLGPLPLIAITPLVVRRWVATLIDAQGAHGQLAPSTMHLYFATLSAALGAAVALGVIPHNPCPPVRRFLPPNVERESHTRKRAFSPEALTPIHPSREHADTHHLEVAVDASHTNAIHLLVQWTDSQGHHTSAVTTTDNAIAQLLERAGAIVTPGGDT